MTQAEAELIPLPQSSRLPSFEMVTSGALAATLGLLLAGLMLAMLGIHYAWVQGPTAIVIAVGIFRLLPRGRTTAPANKAIWISLAALIVLAIASNLWLRSELVIAGRDGATYANTASFLVDEGGLFPAAIEDPFSGADLEFGAPGFVPRDDGTTWQQFLHATPAAYAFFGELFGKAALFGVNAFLSGVGLLAMFALASRFMGSWWALLATALVGISLPFVYYSRGTFSEMSALILTMGGLWVGHTALTTSPRLAVGAGVLLGGATLARVDAWMIGVALGLLFVSVHWMGDSDATAVVRNIFSGFLVVGAISLIDIVFYSEPYLANVGIHFIALIVVTMALRLIGPIASVGVLGRLYAGFDRHRSQVVAWAAYLMVGFVAYLWFGRLLQSPDMSPGVYAIAAIQAEEGLPIEPNRAYTELSVWWLTWYLGIPLTIAGFAGVVGALKRSLRPRSANLQLVFLVFAVPTFTYLVRPSVNPDQIWAIRRFLPVSIPLLVIAGVAAIAYGVERLTIGPRRIALTTIGVLVLAAPVVFASAPLLLEPDRAGLNAQMNDLCDRLGDARSVLIINDDPDSPLSGRIGPPLRSWCHLSVAGIAAGEGFAVTPDAIIAADPALLPSAAEGSHRLAAEAWESRLTRAPSKTLELSLTVWIDFGAD